MSQELHTISFRCMNTDVAAWLWSAAPPAAQAALRQVEATFQAAHARFTRFEATSELSALNVSAGQAFAASPELFEVVAQAIDYARLTNGIFNPAVIDALEAAGYDRSFDEVKRADRPIALMPAGPIEMPAVSLDFDRRTIALAPDTRLDLGGIAKGWTVQQAARRLSHLGPCVVDAGGDIAAWGAPPGETGWQIGVADPFDAQRDAIALRLHDAAIATSGIDRRRWQRGGAMQHHLIDPRTGRPSDGDLISATVVAPTTVEAEVFAKTAFLLGSADGMEFIEERPPLAALFVTRAGNVLASSQLENYRDVRFTFDTPAVFAA